MRGRTLGIDKVAPTPCTGFHGDGQTPPTWAASADLPRSAGHPFYERLNCVLDEAGFDAFVEEECAKFYADGAGWPSLAPGLYFRMLLLGYFEGLSRNG